MRVDVADTQLTAPFREPRHVVGLIYPTASPYFTSKSGLSNVPGTEIAGAIKSISGTSQRIVPREGRATIGGLTVTLIDEAGAVSDEIRTQLGNGNGIKGREVRVYTGDSDDFDELTLVETYIVDDVLTGDGEVQLVCADRKREMRKDIFEPKKTTLTASLTDSATTVNATDTSDFATIVHTAAFTDAPSSTVGYVRVKKTGEIFRYTGKTATTFTGVTRGVLGTRAAAITVDGGTPAEKLPVLEEIIYLEGATPQLLYSILTGTILGTANTLPAHWHLGIDTADVDSTAFDSIGLDLWDPNDVTAGQIAEFIDPGKTDGKRFCERELLLLMGCFQPIGPDGVLGLRRLPRVLSDAPPVAQLDASNIVSHSGIRHNQQAMANQVRIDWNYDGEDFTRTTLVVDSAAISSHGAAPPAVFKFKGLTGNRSTQAAIDGVARMFLDRAAEPPIELSVNTLPTENALEVGDVVRVVLPDIEDYAGSSTLDRSFLIEERFRDWVTGRVRFRLFGSSRESAPVPDAAGVPIPDGWYADAGTELSTVLTISADTVTANGSLTGNADMNAAGAIYYYLGNLTIDAGVTVTIDANVQLRIRGFLTINGTIDGAGNGLAGVADPNTLAATPQVFPETGTAGFIGTTQGQGGIYFDGLDNAFPRRAGVARGAHDAFPRLQLSLIDTATTPQLLGIPGDQRGSSGGPGGYISEASGGEKVLELGQTGGDGGAGLAIVCRGLGFGASGSIDLSGADGGTPDSDLQHGVTVYEGAGGGGAPGGLLVLLDGSAVAVPDLSGGNFVANRGATPVQGTAGVFVSGGRLEFQTQPGSNPRIGLGAADLWQSHQRIQYVPADEEAGDVADEDFTPSALTVTPVPNGLELAWTNPPPATGWRLTEIWRAVNNDRSGALLRKVTSSDDFVDFPPDPNEDYFYWIRGVDEAGNVSDWHPAGATSGVGDVPLSMGEQILWDPTFDRTDASDDNAAETYWENLFDGPDWIEDGDETSSSNVVMIAYTGTGVQDVEAIRTTRRFSITSRLLHVMVRYKVEDGDGAFGANSMPAVISFLGELQTFTMLKGGKLAANAVIPSTRHDLPSSIRDESPWVWHTARFTIDCGADFDSDNFQYCQFMLKAATGGTASTEYVQFRVSSVHLIGAEGFGGANVSGAVVAPSTEQQKFLRDDGTWATEADFAGAGGVGLVPDPSTATGKVLFDDGAWALIVADDVSDISTVSQAEAEAGSATTRRWWTAQRVAQAIAALGGGAVQAKVKTANESVSSSTTFQVDDHLDGFALEANAWYMLEGSLQFTAANTTPDIKLRLTFTQTPSDNGHWGLGHTDIANVWQGGSGDTSVLNDIQAQIASREQQAWVYGVFKSNASTGGSMGLQWAQLTSSGTATQMLIGSWLRITKIG